jgi:membrane-bound inhibitor of C-type lysozyme
MHAIAGRVLAIGLAIAVLSGTSAHAQRSFSYRCEDGTELTVAYLRFIRLQAARLEIDGKTIVLPQRRSADGGRYARGGIQFWIKGRSAMLTRQGKTTNCETN